MHQAGGRITLVFGATRLSPRGKATIYPAQIKHDIQVNHDGTVSRTTAATAARIEMTFDRGDGRFKWDSTFMKDFVDMTLRETDVGVLHMATGSSLIGEPAIDTETGEVSGLSIATDSYTQVRI